MRGKRKYIAFLFTVLGLLMALSIAPLKLWEFSEHWFSTQAFKLRGHKEPDPRITIVGIDDASYEFMGDVGIDWPFPRSMWADLLKKLTDAGARVVVFDILFSDEPWDVSEDEAFRTAIIRAQKNGTTVILSASWVVASGVGGSGELGELASLEIPTDTIMEGKPEIAVASALTKLSYKDKELAYIVFEGQRYYSQAVQAYRQILKDEGRLEEFDQNPRAFGVSKARDFIINYFGPSGSIPIVPLAMMFPELLEEKVWEKREGEMQEIRASTFKDGIVFIGSVSTADNDYFWTPYEKMFGVETIAHAFNTLLTGEHIYPVDWKVSAIILALISLLTWTLVVMLRPLQGIAFFIVSFFIYQIFLFAMFIKANYLMEFTVSTASFFTTYFFTLGFRVFSEEAEKHRIRATFGRYMAPDIVKELIDNPKLAELGGIEREVALLFTDIRNYSTISEPLNPHETVEFLNRFLSRASEAIMANGGFVDKFVGDAIMAVFGAPVPLENPCASAVRSALAIVEIVHHNWKDIVGDLPIPLFRVGVGIHYGKVVMGNVGSGRRMDYTCIGDVVNVASRIESETKHYRTAILISEDVYKRLGNEFKCEYVAESLVKGRKSAVSLYKVIHPEGEEVTDLTEAVLTVSADTSYDLTYEEAQAKVLTNPPPSQA